MRTREPGGTRLGVELRRLLLHGVSAHGASADGVSDGSAEGDEIGDIAPRAEALLYAADRAQHIAKVVRPALDRGAVVVQDRYIDSSLAYQGAGRVLDVDEVRGISEWAVESLRPDLTVLLDATPELSAERRAARGGGADRLESEAADFHRAVRQGFLDLAHADPDRFLVLDAAERPEQLHAEILTRVTPLLQR